MGCAIPVQRVTDGHQRGAVRLRALYDGGLRRVKGRATVNGCRSRSRLGWLLFGHVLFKGAEEITDGYICDVPKQIKGVVHLDELIGGAIANKTTVSQEPGCLGDTLEVLPGAAGQKSQKATVEVEYEVFSGIWHVWGHTTIGGHRPPNSTIQVE